MDQGQDVEPTAEELHVEALVQDCLDSDDFAGALEEACRREPRRAASLRRVAADLERFGLIADPEGGRPERLGRFRLEERLGAGGMGVVYRAIEEGLDRVVAVKVVRPEHLYFDGARARFTREVEAVARLQHPGIVPIYSAGDDGDVPYFTMEYVRGRTLDQVLAELADRTPATLTGGSLRDAVAPAGDESGTRCFAGSWCDAVLDVVTQIANALEHAHERGVYHRDVKPSNIIVTPDGRARLLDFGLAFTSDGQRLTGSTAEIGSLPYVAPEQLRDPTLEPGARQDVYGLGVTLYELLTLRCPFLGARAEETRRLVLAADPTRPRDRNRSVPWDLETVCLAAMDPDPLHRYASVADLLRDLEHLRARRTIEARRPGLLLRVRRFEQRHPVLTLAVVLTAIFLAVGAGVLAFREAAARRNSDRLTREAELRAYAARIVSAGLSLENGNVSELRSHLARCPEELRGWEWSWLHKHTDTSRAVFYGHDPGATSVEWSPDGMLLALNAPLAGVVRVFDPRTGRLAHEIATSRPPQCQAWSPGGTHLALGHAGGVDIWEIASQRVVQRCERRARKGVGTLEVAFTPDGSSVLGVSSAGPVFVWDTATGEPRRALRGHRGPGIALAFSKDGRRAATTARDRTLRVWDLAGDGAPVVIETKRNCVAVRFVDEDHVQTFRDDGVLTVWEFAAKKPVHTAFVSGPRGVGQFDAAYMDPQGRRFAASINSTQVRFVSTWTNGRRDWRNLYGHVVPAFVVAMSPDHRLGAVSAHDGSVRVWDVRGGERHAALRGHARAIYAIAIGDGGTIVSADSSGKVHVLDPVTNELLAHRTCHDGKITAVAAANGRVLTASEDKTVRVSRGDTLAEVAVLRGHEHGVGALALVSDRLAATGSTDGTIRVWEFETGTELRRWETGGKVTALAAAGGGRVVSGDAQGRLRVWSVADGALVAELGACDGRIASLAVAGERLVAAFSNVLELFDLGTGRRTAVLRGHEREVRAVLFAPDGTRVFSSGGYDVRIRVWDTATGDCVLAIPESAAAFALALSPDGRTLVSGGMSKRPTVRETSLPFRQIRVGEPPKNPFATYRWMEKHR